MEVTKASVPLFPFTAATVGVARRRLVSDLIAAGALDAAICDAALVLSELLSNALRHGEPLPGDTLRVAWELGQDSVLVCVTDGGGTTRPELGQPTLAAIGGRGLRIVEKLSWRWGASGDGDGTTVWAQVPIRQQAEMTRVPGSQPTLSMRSPWLPGFPWRDAIGFGSWS